jgi:hypothetical protein
MVMVDAPIRPFFDVGFPAGAEHGPRVNAPVAVEVPALLEQHSLHQGRGEIRQGSTEAVLLVGAEKYMEDPPLPAGVGPGKGDAGEDIQKNGVPG